MASITRRRAAGPPEPAATAGDPDRRGAELRLTVEQQEYLTAHGFGPEATRTDFTDPEVRARLVRVLRECGALAPAGPSRNIPSRLRRHLLRAG